jgi:hypothetical protein
MVQSVHQIGFHALLLIAVSVQGITPDRDNLVSSFSLQILRGLPDDPDRLGGQGNSFDEVGTPRLNSSFQDRKLIRETQIAAGWWTGCSSECVPLRCSLAGPALRRAECLLDLLCRLTC